MATTSFCLSRICTHVTIGEMSFKKGGILAPPGRNDAGMISALRAVAGIVTPQLRCGPKADRGRSVGRQWLKSGRFRRIGVSSRARRLRKVSTSADRGRTVERAWKSFRHFGRRRRRKGTTLSGGDLRMRVFAGSLMPCVKVLQSGTAPEGRGPIIVYEIEQILMNIKRHGITSVIVRAERGRRASAERLRCHSRHGAGRVCRHGSGCSRQSWFAAGISCDLISKG